MRVGHGELDLVGFDEHGNPAVFEVKTMVARHAGDDPVGQADGPKLEAVRTAAARLRPPIYRVDIVGVLLTGEGVTIRWIRNADW